MACHFWGRFLVEKKQVEVFMRTLSGIYLMTDTCASFFIFIFEEKAEEKECIQRIENIFVNIYEPG
jgi:hypothetical protein